MSILFSPITIKTSRFRNRVVFPPMVRLAPSMSRHVAETEGEITEGVLEHYRSRARAGTALIIVEATAVDAAGRVWKHGLSGYSDEFLPGLRRLADCIHAEGALAGIQIVHGGPQSSPRITGLPTVAPSAVVSPDSGAAPHALTVDEIKAIQQRFADAAERAIQAGFDVVELHGAHGYLLDSFLSTRLNQRTDEYGGEIDRRCRMLVETCEIVKVRMNGRALLDCRISVFNKRDEGFSRHDLEYLVRHLEAAGVDMLHLSTDGAFKGYFDSDKSIQEWARQSTTLPIIVAGGLGNPNDAELALSARNMDFAAVGTAMLKDPLWTQHAREILDGAGDTQ
jgi:2,4-dienoyl-CoA reductase-like NADH-dependent reductase (Old Yellow Enzyme family)